MSSPTNSSMPPGFVRAYANVAAKALALTKTCLHPDAPAGCNGPAIDAHSIQRSGPLRRVVDEKNKLLTFEKVVDEQPRIVGWREASTFPGFCSKHDDDTFAAIEKQPFVAAPNQCCLVGYRSLCFESHRKLAVMRSVPTLQAFRKTRLPADLEAKVAHVEKVADDGRQSGLDYLTAVKRTYEERIRSGCFDDLAFVAYRFTGSLSVASGGSINPDFDLTGIRLQNLGLDKDIQGLTYGIVLDGEGFAVVFSWPRAFDLMSHFVGQLSSLDGESLATALIIFMFAYSENTYFSATWWKGLRTAQRVRLKNFAQTIIQYATPVNYKGSRMVDWQLQSIVAAPDLGISAAS